MKIDFNKYTNKEKGLIAFYAIVFLIFTIMFLVFLFSDGLTSSNLKFLVFLLIMAAVPAVSIWFDNKDSILIDNNDNNKQIN